MNILCLFAGQGIQQSTLFEILQKDKELLLFLQQCSEAASFNFLQDNLPIKAPQYSQLIIGIYQLALFRKLEPLLAHQSIDCAGYSLGEVSAFLASTKASVETSCQVLSYRTQLMTSQIRGQSYDLMYIAGNFDFDTIKELCHQHQCSIAIINPKQHLVIGGLVDDLKKLQSELPQYQVTQSTFLNIGLPSHTPFYQNIKGQLHHFLASKNLNVLQYPLFNPIKLGKVYDGIEEQMYLDQELYTTLQWDKICSLINEYHYDFIIDLGPGESMSNFLKLVRGNLELITTAQYKSISGLVSAIQEKVNR